MSIRKKFKDRSNVFCMVQRLAFNLRIARKAPELGISACANAGLELDNSRVVHVYL